MAHLGDHGRQHKCMERPRLPVKARTKLSCAKLCKCVEDCSEFYNDREKRNADDDNLLHP